MRVIEALSDNDPVKIKVNRITDEMKQDRNFGDYIKKKPWPDKYLRTHEVITLYRREVGGNPTG